MPAGNNRRSKLVFLKIKLLILLGYIYVRTLGLMAHRERREHEGVEASTTNGKTMPATLITDCSFIGVNHGAWWN